MNVDIVELESNAVFSLVLMNLDGKVARLKQSACSLITLVCDTNGEIQSDYWKSSKR